MSKSSPFPANSFKIAGVMKPYLLLLIVASLSLAGCSSQGGKTADAVSDPIENIPLNPVRQAFISSPSPSVPDADLKTAIVGVWQMANRPRIMVYRFLPDGRYDALNKITPSARGMVVSGTYQISGPKFSKPT